jgi:flagellar biosynthesis chaperone FliJ
MKIKIKRKYEEIFDLSKVPDKEIIKILKIELGKSNSYIQELENEIKKLKSKPKPSPQEIIEIKKEEILLQHRQRIKQLEKIIEQQYKSISDLIIRLIPKPDPPL